MAASRPKMRAPHSVRRPSRRKAAVKSLDSDSDPEEDIVDLDEVRRARSSFYESPQDKRKMASATAIQEDLEVHRAGAHGGSNRKRPTSLREHLDKGESSHHHTHRRRRRKKRKSIESDDGFVYRPTQEKRESHTSLLPKERQTERLVPPTTKEQRISSAPTPERVRILRTLGLETPTPQRSQSQRTRRSRPDLGVRREVRSKEFVETPSLSKVAEPTVSPEPTKSRPRRSTSLRETPNRNGSRSSLHRSQTTVRRTKRASDLPPVVEKLESSPKKGVQRSTSVFGSLFGPPRPSVPEANVQCLTCLDDVPISRAPQLTCGHRMCHPCLKRIFTMSVSDPAHMPPKCCTEDCIPLKYVDKIFDMKFKMKWNKKYQEYTTKNRIYCPAKGCGTWIPPKDIKVDHSGGANGGRKFGTCPRCKTQVCATCNGKRHKSRECPKDESTTRFAEMAKENGWVRCYNCSATVELMEGCNHMTCRCTAEFCMICGAKWKTCDCPWFNYATVEADRLNHMNIPQVREAMAAGNPAINQPRAYREELERRREQEQRDEELARRMQNLDFELNNRRNDFGVFGVGNGAGHFLNENFVQRARDIMTAGVNPAQQAAANRLVAEIRGQHRVDTFATGIEIPVPSPIFEGPILPPPPPRAGLRRSSTLHGATASRRRMVVPPDPFVDSEPDAPRPAVLAGLNRGSRLGRVDAWRQHISGDGGTGQALT